MSKSNWSYVGETSPDHWHLMYPCAGGNHQTPIDIQTAKTVFNTRLADVPLTFTYDSNCFKNVENTGFAFNVTGSPNSISSNKKKFS